ncbi:hypothetical protein C8A05DRAFT_15289 [Staphylotrichum tortipilum]|uniref:Uncharacterized protein n=1 Tax=Staphylotrichum tortipilum TaxID=2831512 RepID=A0AAN6RTZ1_9PEZI|nr:hypothetical protein C8A05DRAFT_15289 [Staphylotrichum longicolle]
MAGPRRKSGGAAAPATPEAPASRRRSQRASTSAQKSKYFEPDSESEPERDEPVSKKRRGRGTPAAKPKKAKKARLIPPDAPSDDDGDDYQEEPEDAKQDADESDEEFDEDAPPKVTFIPLPKLRDTGGIEYADDRLHPNTLAFLKDLKANNKRTWLKAHDAEYRRALKDWESYVMSLTETITILDPTIPELPVKDVNFRIYRDIRFSKDPTPYKPHFSAAFSRTGRKGPYACYYIHLEPSACFIAGGLWHPDAAALARLRASIDERPRRWRRVLNDTRFREIFLDLSTTTTFEKTDKGKTKAKGKKQLPKEKQEVDDEPPEEAAVKAFAARNQEGALKMRPKGFIPDHRDMALLKLRNFTIGQKIPDKVFTSAGAVGETGDVGAVVGALVGFVTHLNKIVMPDPDEDDEDSDEEEGD